MQLECQNFNLGPFLFSQKKVFGLNPDKSIHCTSSPTAFPPVNTANNVSWKPEAPLINSDLCWNTQIF